MEGMLQGKRENQGTEAIAIFFFFCYFLFSLRTGTCLDQSTCPLRSPDYGSVRKLPRVVVYPRHKGIRFIRGHTMPLKIGPPWICVATSSFNCTRLPVRTPKHFSLSGHFIFTCGRPHKPPNPPTPVPKDR